MTEFGRVITQNEHNLHNGNFQFVDVISIGNLLIRQKYAKLKINIGTYFI